MSSRICPKSQIFWINILTFLFLFPLEDCKYPCYFHRTNKNNQRNKVCIIRSTSYRLISGISDSNQSEKCSSEKFLLPSPNTKFWRSNKKHCSVFLYSGTTIYFNLLLCLCKSVCSLHFISLLILTLIFTDVTMIYLTKRCQEIQSEEA